MAKRGIVCGVGVNDMPNGWTASNEENGRIYQVWTSMIKRCYSNHQRYKSYENCEVCEEWKRLSKFVVDVKTLENYDKWLSGEEPYSLDKDIKSGRCNLYSIDHCMFVTRLENTKERNEKGQFAAPPKPLVAYDEVTGKKIEFKTEREVLLHEEKFSRGGVKPTVDNGFKTYRGYRWFTKENFDKYIDKTLGVIDCKKVKETITEEIKREIENLPSKPTLAIVQVIGDDASNIYVRNKESLCNTLGINSIVVKLEKETTQEEVEKTIVELSNDAEVNGIMLQLPLPSHLNAQQIIDLIPHYKDVDALTTTSQGLLFTGQLDKGMQPCTPLGVLKIFESLNYDLEGKNICVIGRSQLFGNAMSQLLMRKNATVTLCHSKTKNLKEITANSDCVISAIGNPLMLDSSYFSKKTEMVIDVGISLVNEKMKGDVNTDDIIGKVPLYTTTPGGTGQITVPMLLLNTVKAYKMQKEMNEDE